MRKGPTSRQKERRTMLGRKMNPGRLGKRAVKLVKTDRKQRISDSAPRRGGR